MFLMLMLTAEHIPIDIINTDCWIFLQYPIKVNRLIEQEYKIFVPVMMT